MLRAKRELGPLPEGPGLVAPSLRPVLAFNEPPTAEVLLRIRRVRDKLEEIVPAARAIEVWAWPDAGDPARIQ